MINETQVEKALQYLRDNAETYGKAVGLCKALDHRRQITHAQAFLLAEGTVAERDAIAKASADYKSIIDDIQNAETDKATINTQLERARITIEVWRTEQANERRGNI